MDQGQASAQQLVSVLLTDKQSRRHPKRDRDPRQDVTEGEGASRKPKKKKRKLKSSPSMPQRQQANREKKLVHSIEYSPRKAIGSSTPERDTDGAGDSDYRPSTADMADSILSSTSNTPSRQSPREHSSRYPNAESSAASGPTTDSCSSTAPSQDGGTPAIIKRGCSPNARGPSPELRRDKYKDAECVELPKAVFESEQSKKKKIEVMIAGKRKEKGKIPMYESTQESDKRKAEDQVEQNEPRKRSKSQKSQKPGLGDCSLTHDDKYQAIGVKAGGRADSSNVRSHAGIEAKSRSFEGSKNQKLQRSFETGADDAQDSQPHGEMLGQSGTQASRGRGQQKRPLNEGWREPYKRRGVLVPETRQRCSCSKLPLYFTSRPNRVPCLATWTGAEHEFFEHLTQISSCGRPFHPTHVVDACRRMLESHEYSKRWDNDSLRMVSQSAHGGPSANGQNNSNLWRAQSSISPPDFYGNAGSSRPYANAGITSRSVPDVERSPPTSRNSHSTSNPVQAPRHAMNGYSPYRSRPVRDRGGTGTKHAGPPVGQPSNPPVVNSSLSHLTPPNSSPLGQRCRIAILSHHACNEPNDSPSGQESVGVKQVPKVLPRACSGLDGPQMSFNTQRQRHQSVPANLFSKKITADERNPLHPSEPQRHDNPLQEISNNTTVLRTLARKLASMEKILERIPAAPPTQVAPVQPALAPAPAPAPTVTAAAPEGNTAEQPPARTRRKKPSRAERQRKLPKLNRNVPAHLRLPEEGIIAIGRCINHYERHRQAPYAFSWDGTLFADYKRLLVKTVNGRPVWTADEINRLRR